VCTSPDPRDRRTRVGAVVETDAGARLLLDTPPELRLQLVAAGRYARRRRAASRTTTPTTSTASTTCAPSPRAVPEPLVCTARRRRWSRCAGSSVHLRRRIRALPGTFKPQGRLCVVREHETVEIAGVDVTPVRVPHGMAEVFAFRIGPLAYVTDAKSIPAAAMERLRGARVLVVNALFRSPHPTHFSIPEAVAAAAAVGAERTYLTHLTHKYAHAELEAELPPHVRPAYDGLTIEI
jgi:phosphoribosyl 1,2-cyclic phosphate phosphodiesterase